MVEVVYYVASSLDGYIATTDGSIEWLSRFHTAGEDHGAGELESSVDALLLGSHTDEFALKLDEWPPPNTPSWALPHRDLTRVHPSIAVPSRTSGDVTAPL